MENEDEDEDKICPAFFRMNLLLKNHYILDQDNDVEEFLDDVLLLHPKDKELDVRICEDGMVIGDSCGPIGTDLTFAGNKMIRIASDDHAGFIKFIKDLPRVPYMFKTIKFRSKFAHWVGIILIGFAFPFVGMFFIKAFIAVFALLFLTIF